MIFLGLGVVAPEADVQVVLVVEDVELGVSGGRLSAAGYELAEPLHRMGICQAVSSSRPSIRGGATSSRL